MPSPRTAIPNYLLYGEPPSDAEPGFVHLESVPDRASLHNWEMQPHRHDGLHHVLLITGGSGQLTVDGVMHAFRAPAFVAVPARVVHGFRFAAGTQGYVLTLSDGFVAGLLDGLHEAELKGVLALPVALDLGEDAAAPLEAAFRSVERELRWAALGRASAIAAQVVLILVTVARHRVAGREAERTVSADLALLARLRPLIEEHFRAHWPVERYAAALGVTAARLNSVCRRVAGCSTLQMVHARLLLEAKRSLIYTGMSMSEIGYALGFEDPAYFSRFFAKREGVSPVAFRRRHTPGSA